MTTNGITVMHSAILIPSLWRVFPITLSSQTDMPSLTTVALNKGWAFKYKKIVHTKSSTSSSLSFIDITPALDSVLNAPKSTSLPPPRLVVAASFE